MSGSIDPCALGGDQTELEELASLERQVCEWEGDDFVSLLKLANLDPSLHLRFGNFAGMDFSGCDLSGCDFTGANLEKCRFDNATIVDARFDRARVRREQLRFSLDEHARTPTDRSPLSGTRAPTASRRSFSLIDSLRQQQQSHRLNVLTRVASMGLGVDEGGHWHSTAVQSVPDDGVIANFPRPHGHIDTAVRFTAEALWGEHVRRWVKAERPGGDTHLADAPAVFSDAPFAPELVALPPGEFWMGSREDEEGRFDYEGPRHTVRIGYHFAIGRYPVTFEEYDWFCKNTKREKPPDAGLERGRRPVVNVSLGNAQEYVRWLTRTTGQQYRLPSEAEWEYACRAGGTDRYSFGDAFSPGLVNCNKSYIECPTEVGIYPSNSWHLSDIHGNVWEWVRDKWHDSYEGAPRNGSAWISKATSYPNDLVLRGGSWRVGSMACRSASRWHYQVDHRNDDIGFRVARTLNTF